MRFTVLIPTYNNGVVIRAAILSVLNQTVRDLELFVVSDGAPAETHEVVEAIAEQDPRVRLFKFEKGERHGEAWRHSALRDATGEAVCYLSDDDFWFPDHLEFMGDLLSKSDFAHTRHTAIMPTFEVMSVAAQLTDAAVRARMLAELTNICSLSSAGHRLDAYRRLPVGWSPAPKGIWTDLHMWRKFLSAPNMRYGANRAVTSLHIGRGARYNVATAAPAANEVFLWRELFSDTSMRDALRMLVAERPAIFPLADVATLARDVRMPAPRGPLQKAVQTKQAELDRIYATRLWRYAQPLRAVWARLLAIRRGEKASAPVPVAPVNEPVKVAAPMAKPRKMRVHLHTVCWNDIEMLPYFFRHYEPWVDRFHVFDDSSTDGSREYLESRDDVIVAKTPRADPNSWVRSAQAIHNTAWKRSIGEADWVIVTNVDEHLYHADMLAYLERMLDAGVTALPAPGYQMVDEAEPKPDATLSREHKMGAPDVMYSRMAVFRPDRIKDTNYAPGRHYAGLVGEVIFPERDEIANLHYKYLGFQRTYARQKALGAKLGEGDVGQGWGGQYFIKEEHFRAHFAELEAACVDVSRLTEHNPSLCWWRLDARA